MDIKEVPKKHSTQLSGSSKEVWFLYPMINFLINKTPNYKQYTVTPTTGNMFRIFNFWHRLLAQFLLYRFETLYEQYCTCSEPVQWWKKLFTYLIIGRISHCNSTSTELFLMKLMYTRSLIQALFHEPSFGVTVDSYSPKLAIELQRDMWTIFSAHYGVHIAELNFKFSHGN